MTSYFDDVGAFHDRFDLPVAGGNPTIFPENAPALPSELSEEDEARLFIAEAHVKAARDLLRRSPNVELYRAAFALEEKAEYLRAVRARDLVEIADALADGAWIDLGTAHHYRLPFHAVWGEVRRSNLEKERGPTVKRGHALDVRKPPGWRPPEIRRVLAEAGWRE